MPHRNRNGRIVLLSNPTAGHGGAALNAARAVARLHQLGLEVEHIAGVDRHHAEELAHDAVASRPEAFVVVGGDGGVSVAIQALAGSTIPLGIIPSGTGNDTARSLGIPLDDVERAADIVAAGRTRHIDLGHAVLDGGRERHFISIAGADYSADVVAFSNRMPLRWNQGGRFVLAAMARSPHARTHHFTLVADGEDLSGDYYLASVGNTRSYGAGMVVCPAADPRDGMLDVTLVRKAPLAQFQLVRYMSQSFRGGVVPDGLLTLHRCRTLRMECPGRELFADGDAIGSLPATLTCEPEALHVLVP